MEPGEEFKILNVPLLVVNKIYPLLSVIKSLGLEVNKFK